MFLFRALLLSLFFLNAAIPAQAGAWPREEGTVFASMQLRQSASLPKQDPVAAVYLEYGFRENLTVGAQAEYDFATEEASHMELFGRWHLPEDTLPLRAALGLAITGTIDEPNLSPTVHFGQGFETPIGPGWADVSIGVDVALSTRQKSYGAFAQLGIKPHDRVMTMVSLDALGADHDRQIKAIPSVAWKIAEGKHLSIEYTHVLEGQTRDEVSLGLWLEF